jgi:hypothetical protein
VVLGPDQRTELRLGIRRIADPDVLGALGDRVDDLLLEP